MSNSLSKSQMREVTLSELRKLALNSYDSLWNQAEYMGRDVKLYLHWTAGWYTQFYDGYHVQIDHDGRIYVPRNIPLDEPTAGTWKRNTGAINLTILGCADANTNYKGTAPPTKQQIESLAQSIAVLAKALDLTIDINHVMTHGEAADNEDGEHPYSEYDEYGPLSGAMERWDLEVLWTNESPSYNPHNREARGGTILRGKANFYNDYYKGKVEEYWDNCFTKIKNFG